MDRAGARPARVAVLASGGGSNLQALVDHASARGAACGYRVVVVATVNSVRARSMSR